MKPVLTCCYYKDECKSIDYDAKLIVSMFSTEDIGFFDFEHIIGCIGKLS